MKTSESIKALMPDLVKAQAEMSAAKKDADNPFFKSKYADLPAVIEAVKDALNKNNLVYMQPVIGEMVQTTIIHSSGEWISDEGVKILCKQPNDPQAQGSAITYARRYGLMSMLGIPAEDDDAEGAMARKSQNTAAPKQTGLCPIHKVPMYSGEKNGKRWIAHKLEDGTYCRGGNK